MLQGEQGAFGLVATSAGVLPVVDSDIDFALKRAMDLSISLVLLAVLLPLLLLVALAVRLDSSGPALFVQRRVGARRLLDPGGARVWQRKQFHLYKFRTMVQNADSTLHEDLVRKVVRMGSARAASGAGEYVKPLSDPRITRLGALLRKTSFDELPQLINVIRGEMSLVGPRPVPDYEVAEYEPWHCERLAALPGLTGLWQVEGRCRVSFDEAMRMDIDYVRNRTLRLDLRILLLTVPAVLRARGAR